MARAASDIIEDIRRFEPTGGNWLPIDGLLRELFQTGAESLGTKVMLGCSNASRPTMERGYSGASFTGWSQSLDTKAT
ncbi:hypothetical protein VT03_01270 [Planctomyces sp. SH-PL14]|nr:hypothetical protein VT03_01270 [Planctomyces sp. SH-PL14]